MREKQDLDWMEYIDKHIILIADFLVMSNTIKDLLEHILFIDRLTKVVFKK